MTRHFNKLIGASALSLMLMSGTAPWPRRAEPSPS